MRILILSNFAQGLVSFRRELMEALCPTHDLWFSVPEPSDDKYVADLASIGAHHVRTRHLDRRGMNPAKDGMLMAHYIETIRRLRPEVVLTYTIKPNVYGGMACRLLGMPYIANITGLGTALEEGGLLQRLTLMLYRRGLREASMVFFQNSANRDFMLERNIVRGPHDLLPGSGVNLERFPALPYPDGETVDFTFISRVMEKKGIEQFLDAAGEITKMYRETRFHVYGELEDGYSGRLEKCAACGMVTYHGMTDNVVAVHATSSCTVHPSFYPEGLSNVLLESCACARPIITTGRPGCGEIVEDGLNGYVVRERDSADLIDKIEQFLTLTREQRREMGNFGRTKVEREFDRKIVVEKYLEAIERAVG